MADGAEGGTGASAPAGRRGRPGYDQGTVVRRAIEVFNERGYDATSMEDLARELGLSKSAIYHHVPSKEHLLRQALDEGLGALSRVIEEAEQREELALERLRRTVERSVHVLSSHLPAVTLVLRVRGNSDAELDAVRQRRDIDRRLAALVQDAVDEGSVRADLDPELVSKLIFGMVNSLTEWYRPGGALDSETVARTLTSIAFEGLDVGLDPATGRGAHPSLSTPP